MSRYLLEHRHEPRECGVFVSFKGHESPLRHRATVASCRSGRQAIWWTVQAASEEVALRLLPGYVAERTTVSRISEGGNPVSAASRGERRNHEGSRNGWSEREV